MAIEGNFNLRPESPERNAGAPRIFRIVGKERGTI